MRKAQVGFIGAGSFISAHHLLTAGNSRLMDIAAIADLDEEKLKHHSSRLKIGYATTDYKRLLEDPKIDLIIIGTKQDLHARLIVESLNAGKWVLCEKLMAQTKEETQAVLAAEQAAKGKLAIGFNRRFAPACSRTKALMQSVKRPWYINYRLMYPNPEKREGFYATQERILYEGCHILDLVCWLLDAAPRKVFMTGDRLQNNCCILDYADGSQVSFMCGSMGSYCLWKEYMEVFGTYTAITISDFVDMRVRGFQGQYDQLFSPYLNKHADEVRKYGFDFYETYKGAEVYHYRQHWQETYGMAIVPVRRPVSRPGDISHYSPLHRDSAGINPDKGWVQSLEHFAECFLAGSTPQNADGTAGALSTTIALALLKSRETGQPGAL